ncbi:MAG: hypothetical protein RLN75_00030 [Longimicrobiales bacterium]
MRQTGLGRAAAVVCGGLLAVAGLGVGGIPAATLEGAAAPQALPDEVEGRWDARLDRSDRLDDGGDWRLHLTGDRNDWGTGASDDLERRLLAAVADDGSLAFTLDAPAGAVQMEGRVGADDGAGNFTFRPRRDFVAAVAREGLDTGRVDTETLLAAALHEVDPASAGALRRAGAAPDDLGDLIAAAIFRVDTTFIAEIRALGYDLDLDDYLAFRIHDVTPDFIRSVRGWGLGDPSADDLIAFRIHEVTEAFVRETRGWAGDDLVGRELIAFRIHDVTEAFVRSMEEAGVPPEDSDQAVAFRIHGVTPELVRQMEAAGFDDLDGDDLVRIRIHRLDRKLGGGGGA